MATPSDVMGTVLNEPDAPFTADNTTMMSAEKIDELENPRERERILAEQQIKLRNLPHKIRKAIVAAIAAYNVTHFLMSAESRGKDIKTALIEISQYHPSVLAKVNLDGFLVATGNWLGNAPRGLANVSRRAASEVGRVTGATSAVSSAANTTRRALGNMNPFGRRVAPVSGGKRRILLNRKRRRA